MVEVRPGNTILVIDDHPLFRRGVAQLLEMAPDLQLVGEASSGDEGVALALQLVPDLVLLDLQMKLKDGIATLGELRRAGVEARVLMLTMSDDPRDLFSAIRAGADGYILKDMEPDELLEAIRQGWSGEMVVSARLKALLVEALHNEDAADTRNLDMLTSREIEILRSIACGGSNKMIARDLAIAEGTVKVHVKHLLQKLQFRSRVELAVWAVEQRLGGE